jgi:putative two-component system response regulator
MNKPVETEQLVARLRNLLRQKSYEDSLRADNRDLKETIEKQNADLAQSRLSVVCRLGMAAEYRDRDTGNHVARVGCYSRAVAAAMGLPLSFLDMLLLAAPLHDIGKIGIPDSILLKPGPLDDDEWAIMKSHCRIGERILHNQSKSIVPLFNWYALDSTSVKNLWENKDPLLDMAATIALTHHEKWDGSGYPERLAGESIPLASRIVTIADVFDALTSNRHYRPARSEQQALDIIDATVGTHFEPRVYTAFLQALPDIRTIREKFNDDVGAFFEPEGAMV